MIQKGRKMFHIKNSVLKNNYQLWISLLCSFNINLEVPSRRKYQNTSTEILRMVMKGQSLISLDSQCLRRRASSRPIHLPVDNECQRWCFQISNHCQDSRANMFQTYVLHGTINPYTTSPSNLTCLVLIYTVRVVLQRDNTFPSSLEALICPVCLTALSKKCVI